MTPQQSENEADENALDQIFADGDHAIHRFARRGAAEIVARGGAQPVCVPAIALGRGSRLARGRVDVDRSRWKTSVSFIIQEMRTPLYVAVEHRHLDVARHLLECGADPNAVCDTSHNSALTAACRNDDVEAVALLLRHGAKPEPATRRLARLLLVR